MRPPFEGELVRLRAIEDEDLPWVNEQFWNPTVTEHLLMYWPETLQGTREWRDRVRAGGRGLALLIESHAGQQVGVAGLEEVSARSRTATLGIWIAEERWGRGYGTDAVRTLCRFGFREMNLQRIDLGVFETNPRGVRAYEKVGFKEEGRLRRAHYVGGRYVDLILMGLLAEELIEEPARAAAPEA